jgi:hypothetical protein
VVRAGAASPASTPVRPRSSAPAPTSLQPTGARFSEASHFKPEFAPKAYRGEVGPLGVNSW